MAIAKARQEVQVLQVQEARADARPTAVHKHAPQHTVPPRQIHALTKERCEYRSCHDAAEDVPPTSVPIVRHRDSRASTGVQ